ncbi:MAG TPA: glycosyltransferase family 4 protein, partial [Burkholderiales bacterium]
SNRMFARRLARVVASLSPDAVFVRHLKIAVLLRERFPALPMLYEAHEVFADTAAPAKRARVAALEACALEAATRVVANSDATAARLRERYAPARPMEVVRNGVERPARMPDKDWAQAAQRIVYAGTLFPWKGAADLVEAAGTLPGCTVTLAGGEAGEIEALRARMNASGAKVVFTGRIAPLAVRTLLDASCIAVLPNRAEADSAFTSPIKLFEYMAAGCAVVAADLPAVREILGERDAAWFAPGDAAALAQAIRGLVDDPVRARRLGEQLYARSAAHTWQARGERLAGLLRGIAG